MYLSSERQHYKSINAGESWEKFTINQSSGDFCHTFTINPSVSSEVVCSATSGLYKSIDSGNHWVLLKEFLNIKSTSYSSDGKVLFVVNSNGVSKSKNQGITWEEINFASLKIHEISWFATDPIKPNIAYALLLGSNLSSGLYKSIDGGVNWKIVLDGALALWGLQLAIDPTRSGRLVGWTKENFYILLYESEGNSWKTLTEQTPYPKNDAMTVSFNPKNLKGLFLSSESGVFESTDLGKSWTLIKERSEGGTLYTSSDSTYLISPSSILKLNTSELNAESRNCLFAWAEQNYPQLFSPAKAHTQVLGDYVYHYYSQSNTYLGLFQDERVHLLQPRVSADIQDIGLISSYQTLSGCH
jgi:photosystem II stability/assembly factor-like uncharacterized protein